MPPRGGEGRHARGAVRLAPAGAVWHGAGVFARLALLLALAPGLAAARITTAGPATSFAPQPPAPLLTDPPHGVDADFAAWLAGFRADELARGLPVAAVDATVGGLRYSPRVVELDRAQPGTGTAASFADYAGRHVEGLIVARGRNVRADVGTDLAATEATTGVPGTVVLGIWGMESSFGAVTGTFDVPRSLATLAFDGRRRDLFTRELAATVDIVARGTIPRERLTGSWAGAMGQTQFLPSTYLAAARDGDGDGRADIWLSRPDIVRSIATKLAADGWRAGAGWGFAVTVPPGLDRGRVRNLVLPTTCITVLAKHSRWIPIGEWRALGLTTAMLWPPDDALATLVEPDGPGGRAFLTLGNYRALLGYNCSNFYALSVGLLSDELR